MPIIAISAIAAGSALGVMIVRRYASLIGLMDLPNERSSHVAPTPRGGGLAIVVAVATGMLGLTWGCTQRDAVVTYLCAAGLIAAVSLADDVFRLSAVVRFGAQVLAAAVVVWRVGYWTTISVPFFSGVTLGGTGAIVTMLWIVGVTNAYNFMDGIDGIAGTQAVIAGLGWAVFGILAADHLIMLLGAAVAAASAGFLIYNWQPASIFMGDVGSAFLGFTFATIPLLSDRSEAAVWPAILLVWPFLFDSAFTVLRRLRSRENVFAAHRSHLYQRLTLTGKSHSSVAITYGGLATVGVAGVLYPGVVAAAIPLAAFVLWRYVAARERSQRPISSATSAAIPSAKDRGV